MKAIEVELGREPTFRYGPRGIDIDILLYGDRVLDQAGLQIPHARLHERDFVLAPLNEIAAEVVHPQLGQTIGTLSAAIDLTQVRAFARRPLQVGSSWWHWDGKHS